MVRRSITVALGLLVVVASCRDRAAASAKAVQNRSNASDVIAQADTAPRNDSVCVGTPAGSVPVAFTRIDLGPGTRRDIPFVQGRDARLVIQTAKEWHTEWRRIADTLQSPPLGFGDSAVILVASGVYGSGPRELRIEEVRRCRDDSTLMVFVRLHTGARQVDYPSRSLRAVGVLRANVGTRAVRFVDRKPVIDQ